MDLATSLAQNIELAEKHKILYIYQIIWREGMQNCHLPEALSCSVQPPAEHIII